MPTPAVDPECSALFDRLGDAFSRKAFAEVRALWAENAERPFYIAEEREQPMTHWDDVEAYWAETGRTLKTVTAKYRLLDVVPMSGALSMASFQLRWSAQSGEEPDVGGELRGAALCATEEDEWKFCAYIEAPLAPILYLRHLYRLAATTEQSIISAPAGASA